jgi:ELWxxDGT repeat protein
MTAANDLLFFRARDGVHGEELWVSDGGAPGTFLVADLLPGSEGSQPTWLTVFNDRLYFVADDGVYLDVRSGA